MNTQTANLGIDLDNTFARFTDAMRAFVAESSGLTTEETARILPDPQTYDLDPWDWTKTAYTGFKDAFLAAEKNNLYADMKAQPGAASAVRRLQENGYRITVITARKQAFADETRRALQTWGFTPDEVVFSNDKHLFSRKMGGSIDAFFDDAPSHLQKFTSNGIPAVAFHNTYNTDVDAAARIRSWSEAQDAVRTLGL